MKTVKLAIGIISINLFCICFLQAGILALLTGFVNGLGNSLGNGWANIDIGTSAGILLSFCMLTGGILAISTRDGRLGGYFSGFFYLVGTVVALFQKEAYEDLWVWMSVCFAFGIIVIICSIVANQKADQDEQIENELTPTELLKLQMLLLKDRNLDFIMSEEELYRMTQEKVSKSVGIIKNAQAVVENTTDIDTFFEQFNYILDTYKDICQFSDFFSFDESPAEEYVKVLSEKEKKTSNFIARYFQHLTDRSASLQLKEKKTLYEKEYETFKKFYHTIDQKNQEIIESEFQKLLTT